MDLDSKLMQDLHLVANVLGYEPEQAATEALRDWVTAKRDVLLERVSLLGEATGPAPKALPAPAPAPKAVVKSAPKAKARPMARASVRAALLERKAAPSAKNHGRTRDLRELGNAWLFTSEAAEWRDAILAPILRTPLRSRARGDATRMVAEARHPVPDGGAPVRIGVKTLQNWLIAANARSPSPVEANEGCTTRVTECSSYGHCLELAMVSKWRGFSCASCPRARGAGHGAA